MRRGSGHKRNKWGPGITKQQEVNVCILYIYDSDKLDSDILTHREGDYRMTRDISSESKSPSQSTKHKH